MLCPRVWQSEVLFRCIYEPTRQANVLFRGVYEPTVSRSLEIYSNVPKLESILVITLRERSGQWIYNTRPDGKVELVYKLGVRV